MRTSLFSFTKLFSFAILVAFSACTQTEDPVPTTPDTQNPSTGLPNIGGIGGTAEPGGGTTGGGTTTNPGNNGGQNAQSVGIIASDNGNYDFPYYLGAETESQANESGAYLTEYYYADEDAANDQNGDDNIEGVVTLIAFNSANAGAVSPGQYAYTLGSSDAGEFPYIMVMDRGRLYLVSEALIQIGTTNTNDIYGVVFEGEAVEVEFAGEELNVVSNPFDMEGQFLIPASSTNSLRQEYQLPQKAPFKLSDLANLSF